MAGKAKTAAKLANHLGEPIDSACAVSRPGSAAGLASGAAGGLAGVAAGEALLNKGTAAASTVDIGTISWLALGPSSFSLTNGDKLFGKPKGDPIARFSYDDVKSVDLNNGKISMRADVALADGSALAFEAKNRGPANKPNVEVLELFKQRCEA